MIIRVQKSRNNPFVIMDKRPLEDARLSFKAKGILAYLLSRPDDWVVRIADLCNHSPDGPTAVRAAMKELAAQGYAILQTIKDKDSGKIEGKEWIIFENPEEKPTCRFPERRFSHDSENPHLTNNEALPIKRPTKEKGADAPAVSSELPDELNCPEFASAWADWKQYRSELKKKLTPSTVARQLKTLVKFGIEGAILAINQSIEQGWTGLFPPKENRRHPADLPKPRKAKSPPPGLLPVSDQPTPGYDKAGNEISMAEWDRLYPLWNYYEVDTLEPCAPPPLAS